MAKAIIGQPFTFTVLFLDALGNPVVPPNPSIEAFYFVAGIKTTLVGAGTPMVAVAGDLGRFSYTVVIPATLNETLQIYAVMEGTDPNTGFPISTEQEVDLFQTSGGGGGSGGLRVSVV
jgi:hypothetical protein